MSRASSAERSSTKAAGDRGIASRILRALFASPRVGGTGASSPGPARAIPPRLVAVVTSATLVAVGATAGPAVAGKYLDSVIGGPSAGATGGLFNAPRGAAVNESTGQLYVADSSNNRIQRFSSTGAFERAWGADVDSSVAGTNFEICTVAASCKAGVSSPGNAGDNLRNGAMNGPHGVAVNQITGDVYVRDRGNNRVNQYDADGAFIRSWGWDVRLDSPVGTLAFEICTAADRCKIGVIGTADGQFGSSATASNGIAIHPVTGDVFVVDPAPANRRLQQFEADGDFVRIIGGPGAGTGEFASGHPLHVAVDADGVVYATDSTSGPSGANNILERYDLASSSFVSPPIEVGALSGTSPSSSTSGLQIDRSTGNLFVARNNSAVGVLEFATPGAAATHVDTHFTTSEMELPSNVSINGIALNADTGELFVVTSHRVFVLDDDGAAPIGIVPGPATNVQATTAGLHADIDPNGPTGYPVSYRFEVSKDGIEWLQVTPDQLVGSDGESPDPVALEAEATGLEANTSYRFRVVASRPSGAGSAISSELTFITDPAPPEVETSGAQHVSGGSAQIVGQVNPGGLPTSHWFEWGDDSFGNTIPVPAASTGSGSVSRTVGETLTGLIPERLYHFRLCAQNSLAAAKVCGVNRTFTTRSGGPAAGARALEMVTSPDKVLRRGGERGSGTEADLGRLQRGIPSPNGGSFLANVFAGLLDPDAGAEFSHDRGYEIRRRTSSGWRGEAVVNVAPSFGSNAADSALQGLSADLNTQRWLHHVPMFGSGAKVSTRVMGDGGGPRNAGWYPFLDPAWYSGNLDDTSALALIDDDGERLVAHSGLGGNRFRDITGVMDSVPASGLTPSQTAGGALFLSGPPIWAPLDLINECTGSASDGDATRVPQRSDAGTPAVAGDDTIGALPCEAGSPTHVRGAMLGSSTVVEAGAAAYLGGTEITAMSDDGGRVFFTSPDPVTFTSGALDTNLCSSATGSATVCPPQLFVRQYDSVGNPTVRWISRAEPGLFGTQSIAAFGDGVSFEGASRDGTIVYFRTDAPLTADDPNGGESITAGPASRGSWDVYRYELASDRASDPTGPSAGGLTRVSGGPEGDADPSTNVPGGVGGATRFMSDSGEQIYFATTAAIGDSNDSWNAPPDGGATTVGGVPGNTATRNLYFHDSTRTGADAYQFVAQIPYALPRSGVDSCASSETAAISSPSGLNSPNLLTRAGSCVHGTSSGDAVVFETTGRLTSDDTDNAGDVYLYDANEDSLTRLTAPSSGFVPYACVGPMSAPVTRCNGGLGSGNATGAAANSASERFGLAGFRHDNIGEDAEGRLSAVFFETTLPLAEGDSDELMDVYEWRDGNLSLVSANTGGASAFYTGNTRDGVDVFFWTEQPISAWEIDAADGDVYNATLRPDRLPEPPASPAVCAVLANGCQNGGPAGPLPVATNTSTPVADGNAVSRRQTLFLARPGAKALRRAARVGTLSLRLRTSEPGVVRVGARARIGRKSFKVAAARKRVGRPGSARVALRLSSRARKMLRRGRALRVTLTVAQSGGPTRTATVRLKRSKRS